MDVQAIDSRFFTTHPHWPFVQVIASTLLQRGHRAVLAGGCVRDALLGRLAKDLDIATDATPDQIESYFPRVLPLGKSFGVCRVIEGNVGIEVATFREEFDYQDGRRPERVCYSTLEQDALRRDFTINALFYDLQSQSVIDVVGGAEDLRLGLLRAVGDPDVRFTEDYLRILRGVRFSGHLHFPLEERTAQSLKKWAPGLKKISNERIYEELDKMFSAATMGDCFSLLCSVEVLPIIFKDWPEPTASLQQWMSSFSQYEERKIFAWTAIYFFVETYGVVDSAKSELTRLKVPHKYIQQAQAILASSHIRNESDDESLVAFIKVIQADSLKLAKIFWTVIHQNNVFTEVIERMEKSFLGKEGVLATPKVSGHDILRMGKSGPVVKELLQKCYLQQLRVPNWSTEELLQWAVQV